MLSAIYRLAVSLWLGGAAIFTFVITPILFRTEARDTAARIVGVLFPSYFLWGFICGAVALLALIIQRGRNFKIAMTLLIAMLAINFTQAFFIEPRAAKLKKEIISFEATLPDHPLRKEFARLHGVSAAGNIAVIAGGAVLIILL